MPWSRLCPSTTAARVTRDGRRAPVMNPDIYLHLRQAARKSPLAIGPGKIALLEAIERAGSITAAAKGLGMSYRRAWLLVDETNRGLIGPAVETATGGSRGGGTTLTPIGHKLVRQYRALERDAAVSATRRLHSVLCTLPSAMTR